MTQNIVQPSSKDNKSQNLQDIKSKSTMNTKCYKILYTDGTTSNRNYEDINELCSAINNKTPIALSKIDSFLVCDVITRGKLELESIAPKLDPTKYQKAISIKKNVKAELEAKINKIKAKLN
jgi:hypothetical protein